VNSFLIPSSLQLTIRQQLWQNNGSLPSSSSMLSNISIHQAVYLAIAAYTIKQQLA
jgi:hypothetical protein